MRSGQRRLFFAGVQDSKKDTGRSWCLFRFPGAATEASLPGGSAFPAFGAVQGGVVLLDGLLLVLPAGAGGGAAVGHHVLKGAPQP